MSTIVIGRFYRRLGSLDSRTLGGKAMFGLGYSEMVLFGIIALVLFGSRLPEVARSLGGSYRELKNSVSEFQREFQSIERYEPPRPKVTSSWQQEEVLEETTAPRFQPPTEDSPKSSS
jgi:sec-independent protein translocase protein TatA